MAAFEQAQVQVGDSWGQLIFEQEGGSVLKKLDEVNILASRCLASRSLTGSPDREISSPCMMPASRARRVLAATPSMLALWKSR